MPHIRPKPTKRISANFVIGATGLLRIPQWPEIDGIDDFTGPSFHSTYWNHDVDLTGKRVAVIGTGASANQIVPAIAPTTGAVLIYQRTPHWMLSHPQYGKALSGTERELIDEIPTYLSWFRFRQFWQIGDSILPTLRIARITTRLETRLAWLMCWRAASEKIMARSELLPS